MRLLVTGGGGMLGRAVSSAARLRGWSVRSLARHDLDVTDAAAVRHAIAGERPAVVVHCAAYTAVDTAEDEPDEAMAVNRGGTGNVVSGAAAVGATVIYPSTDYVFDGSSARPYLPDDAPHPLGAYGRSKLAGEMEVRRTPGAHLIVRTSWLYGVGGRNFVDTVRRQASEGRELRVVADQEGRPTWTASLAVTLLDLIGTGASGTLHACDAGHATWYDLARAVVEITGLEVPVVPVSTAEWGARAPRPARSLLDLTATETLLRRPLPHWRRSLMTYLSSATHPGEAS